MVSGHSLGVKSNRGVIDSIPASVPAKGNDCFSYFLLLGSQSALHSYSPKPALLGFHQLYSLLLVFQKPLHSNFWCSRQATCLKQAPRMENLSPTPTLPQFLPQEDNSRSPRANPHLAQYKSLWKRKLNTKEYGPQMSSGSVQVVRLLKGFFSSFCSSLSSENIPPMAIHFI